jgi:hypothetical protein
MNLSLDFLQNVRPKNLPFSYVTPKQQASTPTTMHVLQESTTEEVTYVTYVLNSQIMSYILNILICVDMILSDNLLQCFIVINLL